MPFVFKSLALLLSISAAAAADKETPFKAAPAVSYASHQSNAQITIGVDPYVTLDKVKVVEYNSIVEIVFQGTNLLDTQVNHPVHLHGNSFYVIGSGLGSFNNTTDRKSTR